jgi:hypothetical protein
MVVEAFHSTIKDIHLALEVKTSFDNSMPTTGSSMESSTRSLDFHWQPSSASLERSDRNLHTKRYKGKLEWVRSARLIRHDQAVIGMNINLNVCVNHKWSSIATFEHGGKSPLISESVTEIRINNHLAMEITWQHDIWTASRALRTATFC